MNHTIAQALKHVWLEETDAGQHRFVFPRLSGEIQDLYHDLKVAHDVLLSIFPEFLDIRTDLALCAQFTGLRVTAESLLRENHTICTTLLMDFAAGQPRLSWSEPSNRPYYRSVRELAYTLAAGGKSDEAVTHARQLLSLDPDDPADARSVLALAFARAGQFDKILLMAREFENYLTPELALGKVLVLLTLGRESDAFRALMEAYAAFPGVVREVGSTRHKPASLTTLLHPFTERDQAQRYWRDFGRTWQERPATLTFVRWFLRGGSSG